VSREPGRGSFAAVKVVSGAEFLATLGEV